MLSATVQAWPEQQQLVALALLNLHECDADEYERRDVAATAGAAGGAAPAPPSSPLLGRVHSSSPPAAAHASPLETRIRGWDWASKLITLVWRAGFSPGDSRSGRVRERLGCPVPLSAFPQQVPRQAWVGKCPCTRRGQGDVKCPLCPQLRAHPRYCSSTAAAARKPG